MKKIEITTFGDSKDRYMTLPDEWNGLTREPIEVIYEPLDPEVVRQWPYAKRLRYAIAAFIGK